jgi:two-component system, NarL family, response regulator YdfI
MDKRGDIPLRILLVAGAARRDSVAGMVLHALNGRVQIASDTRISPERLAASKSDILLADLDSTSAAEAMIHFLESAPAGTGSVALIDEPDPQWVRSALLAPINGIIARDASAEELQLAIQAAEAGLVLLHPTSVRSFVQHGALPGINDGPTEELLEQLTSRESEVLRLVSMGLSNKEVAARLAISEHTVKFHISSILGKLHAASRTEAVSLGIRRGLIPI